MEIWAKDQYGNEAHYLSPGFKYADVKKDVESGVYPFYIGEKKESDIKANYENGILTISFPKEETPKKEIPNITIK